MLKVESLSISFPRKRLDPQNINKLVVDNVSFEVPESKTVAIIGESGSGKTMTALSILGILPKNAQAFGSIKFDGEEILKSKYINEIRCC